ncbi:GLPGLI family protein [Proteiniphilum acetatigenes]|uniref:GLPGLI family protein n=1 Tax=Proteiniphilum acetatigenes TaxID=294710 RepID=UPI00036AE134|nr:GLPGLI family protein [Proteiniphilum acetatigenes]
MRKILFLATLFLLGMTASAQRVTIPDLNAYSKLIPVDSLVFTVQYDVSIVEDTSYPDNLTKETMMLRVGETVSEFYSYTSFIADSVLRADVQAGASQLIMSEHLQQYGFGVISHRIYKHYPRGQLTLLDRIAMDNFVVEEPMPKIDWTIHPDTVIVCGYSCQKATAHLYGREYEAWFAPEIPRSDGPWKLHGLPGIILKAEDTQKHYRFIATGIEQSRTASLIEMPETSRKKVSRKELNRLHERFNADPQGYIKVNAPNVKLTVKDNMGNDIRKMSNPHNPIELN